MGKRNKLINSIFFSLLISNSIILFGLVQFATAEELSLGPEPIDDLKIFNPETLEDIDLDYEDIDDIDDIKQIWNEEIWPQGVISARPDYIDMQRVYWDISGDTATLTIEVQGDPEGEDVMILIWGDCHGSCEFMIIGLTATLDFGAFGNATDINYFAGMNCDEEINGSMDIDSSSFSFDIPSDWLGNEDCDLFIAILTTTNIAVNPSSSSITPQQAEDENLAIDVFPNNDVGDWTLSIWDWILLLILIIAFVSIQMIARYKSVKR